MSSKRKTVSSPLKIGLTHAVLSFVTFAGVSAAAMGVIHMTGDSEASGPVEIVALFNPNSNATPHLKSRLEDKTEHADAEAHDKAEPDLGVEYDDGHGETQHAEAKTEKEVVEETETVTHDNEIALAKAPISEVTTSGRYGRLPKIADSGLTPAKAYARPFENPSSRPMIAVVVGGLGLNRRNTQTAIDELPPEVTLSFVPYARGLQTWVDKARAAGHEVLIEVPMEPYDFPNNDTGPYTLLTSASASENQRRLEWLLSQANGYFGLTNYQGAKFATDAPSAGPMLEAIKNYGLVFIHDGAAPRSILGGEAERIGVGYARADRVIDATPSATSIDEQLLHLEAIALQRGSALGSAFAYPVTIDQLRDWTSTLDYKGYMLAPASALTDTTASVAGGSMGKPS